MTQTIRRILVGGIFTASAMVAGAQTSPAPIGTAPQAKTKNASMNAAESNPACQQIVAECKKLGYIVGAWKKDNGLWKDCFDPVVKGGHPTRDGKAENVPVSSSTVEECRAATSHK